MTPKQTALTNTLKLVGTGLLGGATTAVLLQFFTLTQIGIGFCAFMLAYMIKFVYDVELDKARTLEELNQNKG